MSISPQNLKAFIFDWGGVLIENPAQKLVEFCADFFGVLPKVLAPLILKYIKLFEIGAIGEQQMWNDICDELNVPQKQINKSVWGSAIFSVFKAYPEMLVVLEILKNKGYLLGFLSNTEPPAVSFFMNVLKWSKYFDVCIFSCTEQVAKPHQEIYLRVCDLLKTPVENVLMIDDKPENIEGAQKAGLQGYLFTTPEQFVIDFKNWNLL